MNHQDHPPAIDTVVFDLGNVLIRWNPRNLYRKLFGADEQAMETFLSEVCSTDWNERQDAGRSWQEAIDEAIARHPTHETLIPPTSKAPAAKASMHCSSATPGNCAKTWPPWACPL